jgi:hypothetical protein
MTTSHRTARLRLTPTALLCSALLAGACTGNIEAGDADSQSGKPGSSTQGLAGLCVECLNVRVGRPLISRGPVGGELDGPFNEIRLPDGQFRGFSAGNHSYTMHGANPWSMQGPGHLVLRPGPRGSFSECGRWISDTEHVPQGLAGIIHCEHDCDYRATHFQSDFSVALGISHDHGLTWDLRGQILRGPVGPTDGIVTGEGNCTVVLAPDRYLYAYCEHHPGAFTMVARAPASSPGPGHWWKHAPEGWTEPGLDGTPASLGYLGTGAGRWVDYDQTLLLGMDFAAGGLKLSLSPDHVTFQTLAEPLVVVRPWVWVPRPDPSEALVYPSFVNPDDGNNQVGSHFLLTYMYMQPDEGQDAHYLVMRDVWLWLSPNAVTPQVGIALSRWRDTRSPTGSRDRWTTTAAVPGNFSSWEYEGDLGYLQTRPHPTLPTLELIDCVSSWPGFPDHMLATAAGCDAGGYRHLRTAGWVYQTQQPGTVPLYSCYDASNYDHFVSNHADCEGIAAGGWLLGFAAAD